ncbi:radical SAM protein [Deltaproteobacteria bacterium OttesenSCG-928-K17]|nr:radical SAM protein [Deltaproteobacteria bacterium OttesenSCG-928-K17]
MPMNANDLKSIKSEIYLWGARQLGLSTLNVLRRKYNIEPAGFVDSSPDLQGHPVHGLMVEAPSKILARPRGDYFIIITSGFFYEEISEICQKHGLVEGENFVTAASLQRFDYQIDVSGSCNLKCISCPRGNYPLQPQAGFMKPETFEKVLDKILAEDPFVGAVALYNFGEPLLNPHLPQIIRLAHARGIQSAISTNLSFNIDLTETVKAAPAWFRVSVSGWQDNYEVTHTGGNWKLFLKNLKRLHELKNQYTPDLNVEVFYHIYKNRESDQQKLAALCAELGFPLRLRHAALAPLDIVSDIIHQRPLPPQAAATQRLQLLSIEKAMEIARQQKDMPCPYQRCLWITWDLKVRQCMEWFAPELDLAPNYLDIPIDEIEKRRRESAHCRQCMSEAIHRCYIVYGDESLIGHLEGGAEAPAAP